MPKMNGYEATIRLRRRGFSAPILALTANAMNDDMQKCISCGMNAVILKPVTKPELIAAIAQFVPNFGAAPATSATAVTAVSTTASA